MTNQAQIKKLVQWITKANGSNHNYSPVDIAENLLPLLLECKDVIKVWSADKSAKVLKDLEELIGEENDEKET